MRVLGLVSKINNGNPRHTKAHEGITALKHACSDFFWFPELQNDWSIASGGKVKGRIENVTTVLADTP